MVEAVLAALVAVAALGGCLAQAQPGDPSGTSGGSGQAADDPAGTAGRSGGSGSDGTRDADERAGTAGGSGGSGSGVNDEGTAPVSTVGPRLPVGPVPTTAPRPAGPATTATTRAPATAVPTTAARPPGATTTVAGRPVTVAPQGQAGGSGASSPSDDTAAEPSRSAGGSSAFQPAPPSRSPGTRPPPSPAEVRALEQQIPTGPFAAAYVAITSLPPFVLLACLEGLAYALADVPPEQRYPDPFVPGSPMEVARNYCFRFELEPLRTRTLSSGGSSRAVEPADVQVEVDVASPQRIIVREQLRPEVREQLRPGVRSSSRQLFATTLAMLFAVVVLVATAAVAFRRRRT